MEQRVKVYSCALTRQSKGRKKISPVLRSCIGPTAWMIQSCGKEIRQKRKIKERERSERARETKREKTAMGPDLLPFIVALL